MCNPAIDALDVLIGERTLTLTVASPLESREVHRVDRAVFDMIFTDDRWTMTPEDPDMHQRFVPTVAADRIEGRWDASEDERRMWRKDFNLAFERSGDR